MKPTSQQNIQSFAFVLSIGAAVCLSCVMVWTAGPDMQPGSAGESRLDGRINPNNATVESLVRLPGLGRGRAGAIVAYRQNVYREGKHPAFENLQDLRRIRGIGPKTLQGISEWITFDRGGNSRDG
jgi:competence protein ComEA